jgi:AbrB family looped-hinge helix DNA binding protein
VPKAIRDKLQLRGGEALEVVERDGVIELRAALAEVRIVDTDEGPVAEPLEQVEPLTDELVRDVLEQVRR